MHKGETNKVKYPGAFRQLAAEINAWADPDGQSKFLPAA